VWFPRKGGVRKSESVDQEFFVFLPVSLRPFLPSFLPGKLAAFLTFDPLVLPDLLFNEVSYSVKWVRIDAGRKLNVFFGL